MAIYSKESISLLCDLINASNPTLVPGVTPTNIKFGTPAAFVPANGNQNTKLTLFGIAAGPYIGKTDIVYRRIDLSKLTRGMTIQINRFSSAVAAGAAGTTVYTVHQLLPFINAKYGLSLTTADITDANIAKGSTLEGGFNTTTITVTAKSTSLGFIGSFSLKWKQAPQDLALMISVATLAGRVFPGGNVFDGSHPKVVNSSSFGVDFTDVAAATPWLNYPTGIHSTSYTAYTVAFINAAMAEINRLTGTAYPTNAPANNATIMPLGAIVYYALPNVNVPEANSKYFNRCLVMDLATDGQKTWFGGIGRFIFHFNV